MESDTEKLSGDSDLLLSQLSSFDAAMIAQLEAKDNRIRILEKENSEQAVQLDGAVFTIENLCGLPAEQHGKINTFKALFGLHARIARSSTDDSVPKSNDHSETIQELLSQLDEKDEAIKALQNEVESLRNSKTRIDNAMEVSAVSNDSAANYSAANDAMEVSFVDDADDQFDSADYSGANDSADYTDFFDDVTKISFVNDPNDYSDDSDDDATEVSFVDDPTDYSDPANRVNLSGVDPDASPDVGPFASLFRRKNNGFPKSVQPRRTQDVDKGLEVPLEQCLEQIKILVADDLSTEARDNAIHHLIQTITSQHINRQEWEAKDAEITSLQRQLGQALNVIVAPSANVAFEDSHIGTEGEEEVEEKLAAKLPSFVDYIDYNVASGRNLEAQWRVKSRYDNLDNQQKRVFNHFFSLTQQSKAFEQDKNSNLNGPWAWHLNTFVSLAESISKIVPNGCWIVDENAKRHDNNDRPSVRLSNTIGGSIVTSARVVCYFKFGSQALKEVHASHICGNGKNCINPSHVTPEPASLNEKRSECFLVGSAATCRCVPNCLFLRDGALLACRSDPQLNECQCDDECFREVNKELAKRERASRKRQCTESTFDIQPISNAVWGENRNGNPCLVFNELNFTPYREYDGYSLLRNTKTVNKRDIQTYLYMDDRCFFITSNLE